VWRGAAILSHVKMMGVNKRAAGSHQKPRRMLSLAAPPRPTGGTTPRLARPLPPKAHPASPSPRRRVVATATASTDGDDALENGDGGADDGSRPPPARRPPTPRSRLEAKQSTRLRSQLRAMLPDPVDDPLFDAGNRERRERREGNCGRCSPPAGADLATPFFSSFFLPEQSVRRPGGRVLMRTT